MAQRRQIILICDLCGSTDMVETHRVIVDGTARDAEACNECWGKTLAAFAVWATQGRAPATKKARVKDAVAWPDTPWKFTPHAMERMGKRRLSPASVLRVIADQEVRRPGRTADSEIWIRGRIKVVVVPESQTILTVAHLDESDGDFDLPTAV